MKKKGNRKGSFFLGQLWLLFLLLLIFPLFNHEGLASPLGLRIMPISITGAGSNDSIFMIEQEEGIRDTYRIYGSFIYQDEDAEAFMEYSKAIADTKRSNERLGGILIVSSLAAAAVFWVIILRKN